MREGLDYIVLYIKLLREGGGNGEGFRTQPHTFTKTTKQQILLSSSVSFLCGCCILGNHSQGFPSGINIERFSHDFLFVALTPGQSYHCLWALSSSANTNSTPQEAGKHPIVCLLTGMIRSKKYPECHVGVI